MTTYICWQTTLALEMQLSLFIPVLDWLILCFLLMYLCMYLFEMCYIFICSISRTKLTLASLVLQDVNLLFPCNLVLFPLYSWILHICSQDHEKWLSKNTRYDFVRLFVNSLTGSTTVLSTKILRCLRIYRETDLLQSLTSCDRILHVFQVKKCCVNLMKSFEFYSKVTSLGF